MIISLDYDDTFTADPKFWREFIDLALRHNHKVVCVTARSDTMGNREEVKTALPNIPHIFCNHKFKDKIATRRGYNIDVWIDDRPEDIRDTI